MAVTKPLTLRRQQSTGVAQRSGAKKFRLQAQVIVDNEVFHLNQSFSYAIPETLETYIQRGSVVNIPFNTANKIGIVLSVDVATERNLKWITSLASNFVIPDNLISLVSALEVGNVCHPFDLYRSVLPPLGKIKAELIYPQRARELKGSSKASFVKLEVGEDPTELIRNRILRDRTKRRIAIFPTVRQLREFMDLMLISEVDVIEIGPHLGPAALRKAYEQALTSGCVAGLRSAVFAPVENVDEIIVVDEFSDHYVEQRSPYWNVRDVALQRSAIDKCELFFVGMTPSLELYRRISDGEIGVVRKRNIAPFTKRPRVSTAPQTYLKEVRSSLNQGSVLISVAGKHFANTFVCGKCRNIPRCDCGGKLFLPKRNVYRCSLCVRETEKWSCRECSSTNIYMLSAGAERLSEELRRSFPNVPVYTCVEGKEVPKIAGTSIVIATAGMEPRVHGGYTAIILLNGLEQTTRPSIRSEESLFHRWFRTLSYLNRSGQIYSSLPVGHPISQSLISMSPTKYLDMEIRDRKKYSLPPMCNLITIERKGESLSGLKNRIEREFPSVRAHLSSDSHEITLLADNAEQGQLITSLKALQKVRSVKKMQLLKIVRNPINI